jgi:hypothetical protein
MKTISSDEAFMKKSLEKKFEPAWFGLDSLHGRYITGTHNDIPHGVVQPGETVNVIERAYVLFKSERLFIRETCAASFLIRNVFVGNQRGAIIGQNPLICDPFVVKYEALAELKLALDDKNVLRVDVNKPALEFLGAPFPLPLAQVGLDIMFQIEHIGKEPIRFLGALLGQAAW